MPIQSSSPSNSAMMPDAGRLIRDAGRGGSGQGGSAGAGTAGVGAAGSVGGAALPAAGKAAATSLCTGKNSGDTLCDKATLYTCDGHGGNAGAEVCGSEALCQASVQHTVCAKCMPSSRVCDGATLRSCDASGQYATSSAKQYPTADACEAAETDAGTVCAVGDFACVADTVYKCNDAQTNFVKDTSVPTPCGPGLCNAQLGSCNKCVASSIGCNQQGSAVESCSDDGQTLTTHACGGSSPYCVRGACVECKLDSDRTKTGCPTGNDCVASGEQVACRPTTTSGDSGAGLHVEFCHAGACKVMLSAGFDLVLNADWSKCTGSASQMPIAATSVGVMPWPTATTDLVIPLANTGWLCKLPPTGAINSCSVDAAQVARELYIWGPIETSCTYAWGQTPTGIDATLGAGCGMCPLTKQTASDSADYAFNMGIDNQCRCPKIHFSATPRMQ